MIKQFIIAGLGVGFMAVTNAKSEIGRGALVAVPLAPLPMIRTLGLIYRKDKAFSRPALGFIQVVSEFAAEEPVVVETALRGPRKATRVS
jgi:DNA-binding transcriptional LysR family regulator